MATTRHTAKRNAKGKGPIGETLDMIDGVSSYITRPISKAGAYVDRGIGQMIGKKNPPIRGDEKVAAAARSLGYSYKWNGEEWELRRLSDGRLVKASTDRVTIGEAMREDYFKTHRVNPDYDDLKYDRERVARSSDSSLMREYLEMNKASFGIHGGNAKKVGNLIVAELKRRGIDSVPNIFGPIEVRKFNPSQSTERFSREAEAKAYKRLVEAEGLKAKVEFEPDLKGVEKWVVRVVKGNPGIDFYGIGYVIGERDKRESGSTSDLAGEFEFKWDTAIKHYGYHNFQKSKERAKFDRGYDDGWRGRRRKKSNPESDAASMYEKFHGKASDSIAEFIEEEHYHGNLAALGQLIELKVCTVTGLDATFSFDYQVKPDKGVILASNEEGTALYFVGGDQSLKLSDIKMDKEDWLKDSMVIGDAYFVSYFTEKDFDKFQPTIYEHELGEETGDLPVLRYDRLNKRLYLDGGCYVIKKPMFETSAGIEN